MQDSEIRIYKLSTGALVLDSGQDALLIGGGLPVEQLKQKLAAYREKLSGILVPSEHSHRSRGLCELANQWELPLIGHWRIILKMLFECSGTSYPPQILTDLQRSEYDCKHFHISSFPVKYDSMHPCGWKISAGAKNFGIVQDGRLEQRALDVLKHCDFLVLNNCRNVDEGNTTMAARRIRSVYPTEEQQTVQLKQANITLPSFPVLNLFS